MAKILKKIKTINGKYYSVEETVNIKGDIFWKDDPDVVKDYCDENVLLYTKHPGVSKIISDIKLDLDGYVLYDTAKYIYTTFSNLKEFPIIIFKGGLSANIISAKRALEIGFLECVKSGIFCHPSEKSIYDKWQHYIKFNFTVTPDEYTSLETPTNSKYNIKYGMASPTYVSTEGKKYSFGVELESIKGLVPEYIAYKYNWKAVYDGSLKDNDGNCWGSEYVTGILKGDSGLYHLKQMCIELSNRCKLDKRCGLHVHIGSLSINQRLILAVYFLGVMLEHDFNNLVPPSRRNNSYCKNFSYIDKLFVYKKCNNDGERNNMIEKSYIELFKKLSVKGITPDNEYNSMKQHPMGAKCQYDHSTPRYWWLNLIPMVFNTRDNEYLKTLEFRSMSGSFNFTKIKYWIKLCMGFVYYAENYQEEIFNYYSDFLTEKTIKISINTVLAKSYPKAGNKLIEYFNERRNLFNSGKYVDQIEFDEKNELTTGIMSII